VAIRIAGHELSLDAGYLRCGGLDHGCALTVHQAQGLTCQRAMLLSSDALNREAGYVGLRDRALMLLAWTAALGSLAPVPCLREPSSSSSEPRSTHELRRPTCRAGCGTRGRSPGASTSARSFGSGHCAHGVLTTPCGRRDSEDDSDAEV